MKSKKLGFSMLLLVTPYHSRAIPSSFITYFSETIGSELSSRDMKYSKAISELKELLGDKILVLGNVRTHV